MTEEGKKERGEISRMAVRVRLRMGAGMLSLAAGLILVVKLAEVGITRLSCPFHELTGHSCLTCGMTRSLAAIGHGEVLSAFQHHLFGPILVAGIALWCLCLGIEAMWGRRILTAAHRGLWRPGVLAFGGLWLLYGLTRVAVELLA